ncbi:MAG: divalent-cation tolerance protein CutA [bacterium]
MKGYVVILVTVSSSEEAEKIAQSLVEGKLAACVNIIPGLTSIFLWEGKIDRAAEFLLVIKTREERMKEVIKTVKDLHSYRVPEIIALPIVSGSEDYLKWMDESTQVDRLKAED